MNDNRQEKKAQFDAPVKASGGRGKIIALVAVLAVIGIAGFLFLGQGGSSGEAVVKSVNGEVRIPLAEVGDGKAHFFEFASDQGTIKFFVLKSVDGVMRAAFDTCDVCYKAKKGYRQEGGEMVCNNCNMRFRSDLINEVKGGCNPAPLKRRIDGGQLVINERDLLTGAWYFGS